MNLPIKSVIELRDNHFDCLAKDITDNAAVDLLSLYEGKTLNAWEDLGVTVFKGDTHDDESDKSSVFTLSRDSLGGGTCTKISTYNCMGVMRLRDAGSGQSVQIEIGSRFDTGNNPYLLTYLLSKVFGGSVIDAVDLSSDSLWEMLLALVFRHRFLQAGALGVFKQYRTFSHNDARIRGRINVDRHLRENIPFRGKIAHSTHEISFDNPTNHLIRHALEKVSRKWGSMFTGDSRLTSLSRQLAESTPSWQTNGLLSCIRRKENRLPIRHPFFHASYEPLRLISLAVLRDEGAGLYHQQQEAEGVIFDGAWLWEEYIWTLLKPLGFEHPENKIKKSGWRTAPGVTYYPDFFHRNSRIVLDAKYKKDRSESIQEDAKQVFAYMFLLNALGGGLIKPDGETRAPQNITRLNADETPNVPASRWHDLVITPAKEDSSDLFKKSMCAKENDFKNKIKAILAEEISSQSV